MWKPDPQPSSPPTITVAAADSRPGAAADYTCSGTNDGATIAAAWTALAALDAPAGRLLLLPGSYSIDDKIDLQGDGTKALSVWGYGAKLTASASFPNDDSWGLVLYRDNLDGALVGLRVDAADRAYGCFEIADCDRVLVEHCYALAGRRVGFDEYGSEFPRLIACTAKDAGWIGFDLSGTYGEAIACVARSCGATGQAALAGYDAAGWGDGFAASDGWELVGCHAYICSVNGFSGQASATGCYAYTCGGFGFREMSSTSHCEAVACGQLDSSAGGGFGRITKAFNCHSRLSKGKGGHHLTGSGGVQAVGCSSQLDAADGFLVDTSACQIVGCEVEGAGTKTNNTYSAFHLTAAADGSLVEACKAYPDGGVTNKAKAGVTIDSGCVSAKVVGNDLVPPSSAWQTAPIIDNGTTTKLVYPNHATYGDNFT